MTQALLFDLPCHWVIVANIDLFEEDQLAWLSNDEKVRFDRFRFEDDKKRYGLAHSIKRFCLSKLLGIAAENLSFSEGEKGKPICDQDKGLNFNISHSGNWVLFGISTHSILGVDIEPIEREISDSVLDYALNQGQIEAVKCSNKPQQQFMLFWTQKEAISKALGLGISINFKPLTCSGLLGLSDFVYENHEMTVYSRVIEEDSIASTCSISDLIPKFYKLQSWQDFSVIQI
jgi:4'-phosphopantetheinyl transferase